MLQVYNVDIGGIYMTKVITFGNFKGGTGKTTNSCMIGYHLSKMGYKVLLADLDPQANATQLYLKTLQAQNEKIVKYDTTLMSAVSDGNLKPIITNIKENLDLLPSFADFTSYPLFLERQYPDDQHARATNFKSLLEPIKDAYDFVIIDTPPTVSPYTNNALMASDFTVLVMQTQERSFAGCVAFIEYLREMINNYDAGYELLGILPVLLKNRSAVDTAILEQATEQFGEANVFETVVKNMERLKRYDIIGITDPDCEKQKHDMHDKRVNALYDKITKELLKRLSEYDK